MSHSYTASNKLTQVRNNASTTLRVAIGTTTPSQSSPLYVCFSPTDQVKFQNHDYIGRSSQASNSTAHGYISVQDQVMWFDQITAIGPYSRFRVTHRGINKTIRRHAQGADIQLRSTAQHLLQLQAAVASISGFASSGNGSVDVSGYGYQNVGSSYNVGDLMWRSMTAYVRDNTQASLSGLMDVSIISTPTADQILKWGTTGWVVGNSASSVTRLDQLADVFVPTPAKNQVLKWNGTQWVSAVYNASFTFEISTFTDNQLATIQMGVGTWVRVGSITWSATYSNGPATNRYITHSGWTNLPLSASFSTASNTRTQRFPAVGTSLSWTLNATDGTDTDTVTISIAFYNNRFWGSSTRTSYTESLVQALSGSELSNSRAKSMTIVAGTGYYLVYAYPSRLGRATFTVGGFQGGFEAVQVVSVTNPSGYTEDYNVYRSTNSGLGSCNIVVT